MTKTTKKPKVLADLEMNDCRWPIGDPQQADFHFCGKKKVTGLPYCEYHARRAFQPPQPRRRDREVSVPAIAAATQRVGDGASEHAAEGDEKITA